MALLLVAFRAGKHARAQAAHAVRHHQRRKLAAREHVISNRDFFVRQRLNDALVDALVMAAHQQEAVLLGKLLALFLCKRRARSRHENNVGPRMARFLHLADDIHTAVVNGLRLHHHTRPASVGVVVHLLLPVRRVVPDLMAGKLDVPALARTADDAFTQNALTHLGKQRGDINPHRHFPHRL